MVRVALVEDTQADLEQFLSAFEAYRKEHTEPFALEVFRDGAAFSEAFAGQFDLIFFDIELPDSNGLRLSRMVRKSDQRAVIVFLTKMGQYAIHGYEVDATDYILKPLDPKMFALKMKKILRRVQQNQAASVAVLTGNTRRVIPTDSIYYIEVWKHDVTYHTTEGNFTVRSTLKDVEEALRNAPFSRLSQSFLVNLAHIRNMEKYELTLDSGETLVISRSRKKELGDDLNRYLGGTW
ncbi:MAG: response regulator transcription factor [Lachnospiraceae bacterium]|nr:response regulator transcription factor [Lachnospiraceae bacterium]